MGDRGNIKIKKSGRADLFLYTHWNGSELADVAKRALIKGASRWDDCAYLARVVLQEMIGRDTGVTGYGISTRIEDNEHAICVIDMDAQSVSFEADESCSCAQNEARGPVSFADFIK